MMALMPLMTWLGMKDKLIGQSIALHRMIINLKRKLHTTTAKTKKVIKSHGHRFIWLKVVSQFEKIDS